MLTNKISAELHGDSRVHDPDVLPAHEVDQGCRLRVGHDKLDLHGQIGAELEEPLLVHDPVPAVTCDRPERGAARNAEIARLLEQPFVEQLVSVPAALVNIEAQEGRLHITGSIDWAPVPV